MPDSGNPANCETGISTAMEDGNGSSLSQQQPLDESAYIAMRSSPRLKYACPQRIAPMHSPLPPLADDYLEVECNDISRGGISFFLKRPPGCQQFAIVLGQKPMQTIMVAQVVYAKEVQHNNQQMYLVGCKFINRLEE